MKDLDGSAHIAAWTWFEWPLTPASVGMTSAELIGELYETISALNRDRGWNLTMVAPARFGEIG